MNKKILVSIVAVVALCLIGIGVYSIFLNKTNESLTKTQNNKKTTDKENEKAPTSGKILVVYFSATNNTKTVAEKIAKNLNGNLFEIEPINAYTSEDLSWTNANSRVSKEHNDESLREVELKTTKVENWDNYDTILIGYPIWWGIAAWPVNAFIKVNDFNGKTVIPFCTSASSSLGKSAELLRNLASGGNWLEGKRFSSRPTNADIDVFIESIK